MARFRARSDPLHTLASRSVRQVALHETPQGISNLAWAFAVDTGSNESKEAVVAAASICLQKYEDLSAIDVMSHDALCELATAALGVIWALTFACARHPFLHRCRSMIAQVARMLDKRQPRRSDQEPASDHVLPVLNTQQSKPSVTIPEMPRVVADFPDRAALQKPPGWQVDQDAARQDSENCEGRLSELVKSAFPCRLHPIFSDDARANKGFLHRLDIPGSGLILVGKTYAAYYDLAVQLNAGMMKRQYNVLCHGWLPNWRGCIDVGLHWNDYDAAPTVAQQKSGRSARSAVDVVRRFWHEGSGTAYTLARITIREGRRHQIRAHSAFIGHGTVSDMLYTSKPIRDPDLTWCDRNFLHRCCLVFTDPSGQTRSVQERLPEDLRAALGSLHSIGQGEDMEST
eukprot:TRINITY_DN32734_c0_g2_i2.p1 TRINITY_DN32734_c0_g2~~TRINITY_DN32734_c0_g2_i2.p1  ORF type:complete len:460 (-),score=45.15 TRINITY_DN32734_c0_g2_i2:768-1973(-)